MPNATESQIKNRIAEFVQELDATVRKSTLDALKGILEGGAAPARRGRPAGARRGPGRPPATASADGLAAKITAHVRSSPGQSVGEIVSGVGANAALVKKTIKSMLDAGEIRKAGEKRGTKYFPSGPGRLPGAAPKKKAKARKAKRRAGKKKARKAPARKRAATPKKAVIVPAQRKITPRPREGTMVPEHLDTTPLARVG